jgi:D-lactate dehydrogenase (cytochrome)
MFEIESSRGAVTQVPVPTYAMPDVQKLSAGYYARPDMDLIDLFIGCEGTLGVIVEATLRVIRRPRRSLALVACDDEPQAIALTTALRHAARAAWAGQGTLDVAAIEYMDAHALALVPGDAFARAGVERPGAGTSLLLLQIEYPADEGDTLGELQLALEACRVRHDPLVTAPDDERGAARLFDLREAVPAAVNAAVGAAKRTAHPDIEKTAGDLIVPFDRLADSLTLYRTTFERHGVDCAIWGHASDGNLHANVIPRTLDDVHRGREAILEMARGVVAMGGAPLAEHGVGRSALKQRLLRELYGDEGIEQMRAVKRALDPGWRLAAGVLFPPHAA